MLLREVTGVYFQNHSNPINRPTLCGQNAFIDVKAGGI
jgi:hypothetical protein